MRMRTVKIGDKEYREIKAFAKQRGTFLQIVLTDAIRRYLDDKKPLAEKAVEGMSHKERAIAVLKGEK